MTTHGSVLIQTKNEEVEPINFNTPVKLIKYSAVSFDVCNIVSDEIIKYNIEYFIKNFINTVDWNTISDEAMLSSLE